VAASPHALDVAVQEELWAVSERLSGVRYADYGTSTQRVPR
jgi:hypothetical protein